MKPIASLLLIALLGYAAVVLAVYLLQSKLIYFPQIGREVTMTPKAVGLAFDDVWLKTAPDIDIHGWYVHRADASGTVLFFHGNAGSIALRLDWLRMFHNLGYAVFIVDYRGYGRSQGTPSEQGTYDDASAAWSYLTEVRGVAPGDIVIAGESLGAAVAAELASRKQPRALLIQSTFTSLPDLAGELYRFLPVRWISRYDYGTLARLTRIGCPIMIAHSPDDEIIPYRHGRALFAQAREPKHFIELRGGHNEGYLFSRQEWIEEVGAFLRQ